MGQKNNIISVNVRQTYVIESDRSAVSTEFSQSASVSLSQPSSVTHVCNVCIYNKKLGSRRETALQGEL